MIETEILAALVGAIATLGGTLLASVIALLRGNIEAERQRLVARVARLETEILARIAVEDAALEWIADLRGLDEKGPGLKPDLRDRAQAKSGLRPHYSASDFSKRSTCRPPTNP